MKAEYSECLSECMIQTDIKIIWCLNDKNGERLRDEYKIKILNSLLVYLLLKTFDGSILINFTLNFSTKYYYIPVIENIHSI